VFDLKCCAETLFSLCSALQPLAERPGEPQGRAKRSPLGANRPTLSRERTDAQLWRPSFYHMMPEAGGRWNLPRRHSHTDNHSTQWIGHRACVFYETDSCEQLQEGIRVGL
jgi:hypothetical protein